MLTAPHMESCLSPFQSVYLANCGVSRAVVTKANVSRGEKMLAGVSPKFRYAKHISILLTKRFLI